MQHIQTRRTLVRAQTCTKLACPQSPVVVIIYIVVIVYGVGSKIVTIAAISMVKISLKFSETGS